MKDIRRDGFAMTKDGQFIDERPICYVCGEPIDIEIEVIKKTETVNGKEVTKTTTIEREPLCIGQGLYRHRGTVKPNCEPDSAYYLRHLGVTMQPDIRFALETGLQIKKEKRIMATLKPGDKKGKEKAAVPNLKERLFEMNKKLATLGRKPEEKEALKKGIEALVAKSNGVYTINPTGYAVQTKISEEGKAKEKKIKEKKEKEKAEVVIRKCPCCGGETKSFFIPGHDGRVKGMFKKVKDGKMKKGELNEALTKIYNYMEKNPDCSLREATEATYK